MLCEVLDRMHETDTLFAYPPTAARPTPPHRAYHLQAPQARGVEAEAITQSCHLPNASVCSPRVFQCCLLRGLHLSRFY